MVYHGLLWFCCFMVYHGLSWFIMVYPGLSPELSWFTNVYRGLSCLSWCIMVVSMVVSMVYHGFSYFIILYHNLSYSQSNNHCWVIPNFQTHPYYKLDLMEISCGPDKKTKFKCHKIP